MCEERQGCDSQVAVWEAIVEKYVKDGGLVHRTCGEMKLPLDVLSRIIKAGLSEKYDMCSN
jgi:hypothetical protein